jgi:hypothetical protein
METIPWEVDSSTFSDQYIAGFFDGDGSLVATLEKQTSKYSRVYRPRIKLNFTQHIRYKDILDDMQKFLDAGTVRVAPSHFLAELVITDRKDVIRILNRMLPHLVIKKQRAFIALEVLAHLGENTRTNRISDESYEIILEKINRIRTLNSKSGGKRVMVNLTP